MAATLSEGNAKLFLAGEDGGLIAFEPKNSFMLTSSANQQRLILATNEDRIDVFKSLLDFYPGPFVITVVVQSPHGAIKKAGRYYSEWDRTRTQIDYFLDYFHDYISFCGLIHVWVTCQGTDGIVVYDQHDVFYVYGKPLEIANMFLDKGYSEGIPPIEFAHAHKTRDDIRPGTVELMKYGKWTCHPLDTTDIANPEEKTAKNYLMKARSWLFRKILRK